MLTAMECQRRAEEFARLAEETVSPVLIARYRQLERAWRHLAAMKLKARSESAAPARIEEPA